jgi:hypothetical protein
MCYHVLRFTFTRLLQYCKKLDLRYCSSTPSTRGLYNKSSKVVPFTAFYALTLTAHEPDGCVYCLSLIGAVWLSFEDELLVPDQSGLRPGYALDGTHLHPSYIRLVERCLNNGGSL